jgi:hypothetical protein
MVRSDGMSSGHQYCRNPDGGNQALDPSILDALTSRVRHGQAEIRREWHDA